MSQVLPPKKDVALALLERASVFVHLDPRGAGVVVPVHFKRQPRLVLQIGLNMAVPIPDLRLDDQGLSCTLSFNRSLFHCVVPWSGIFALVGEDGRGMVWPEDVPQEIAREMAPQQPPKEDRADDQKPDGPKAGGLTGVAGGRKRPHVALVTSGGVRADSKRSGKPSKGAPRRKRDDADKPTLFKVETGDDAASPGITRGKPAKPGTPSTGAGASKASDKKRGEDRPSQAGKPSGKPAEPTAASSASPASPASPRASASPRAPAAPPSTSAPAANPSTPAGPSTPSSSPPGKRSPKRELPPYLRVVK